MVSYLYDLEDVYISSETSVKQTPPVKIWFEYNRRLTLELQMYLKNIRTAEFSPH